MTVWDFMTKLGKDEKFNIFFANQNITKKEPVSVHDVNVYNEERAWVLECLEKNVVKFDAINFTIFCE